MVELYKHVPRNTLGYLIMSHLISSISLKIRMMFSIDGQEKTIQMIRELFLRFVMYR